MDEREREIEVQRLGAGDAEALQRLIVHYHQPLRRAVARAIEAELRHRIEPEDVLQQAYVAAFKSFAECRFDGPAGFFKWLEVIALARLQDERRALRRCRRNVAREVRASAAPTDSYPLLIDRLAATDSTPSRKIRRREAIAAVMSSLARLTDEQRLVVRMRFLEGESVAEVAERLGKTEAAVHMLCHRGLKALREPLRSITRFLSRL